MTITINSENEKNVFLTIGFMCSGKTTYSRLAAQSLNIPFVDLDEYIENKTRMEISDIFYKYGESYFREIEHNCFLEVLMNREHSVIIASGGGLLSNTANIPLLSHCIKIYLDIPWRILKHRLLIKKNILDRPLAHNNISYLYRLWQNRRSLYKKYADYIIRVKKDNNG